MPLGMEEATISTKEGVDRPDGFVDCTHVAIVTPSGTEHPGNTPGVWLISRQVEGGLLVVLLISEPISATRSTWFVWW